MTIYFSPSNKGFFSDELHTEIPADAIEITAEQHAKLLEEQAAGKQIGLEKGKVTAVVVKPKITWEYIRSKRSRLLSSSDWTQVVDADLSDEQKQAWRTYRQALRDVPETFSSPDKVVWPTQPK